MSEATLEYVRERLELLETHARERHLGLVERLDRINGAVGRHEHELASVRVWQASASARTDADHMRLVALEARPALHLEPWQIGAAFGLVAVASALGAHGPQGLVTVVVGLIKAFS